MDIKKVVLLNKTGDIIDSFEKTAEVFNSSNIYPVVIEHYPWDQEKQHHSAETYKDQIKRVYTIDSVPEESKQMIQDDLRRIELVKMFNYGAQILEVGCSDGTISIKLAELPATKSILGIDIRQSAIDDGHALLKKLVEQKEITSAVADKVMLEKLRIEDLPTTYGQYDSVCAYEVFEHMSPQDFFPAFQHLYKFIKKDGTFFISVPNRFHHARYDQEKRSRWRWHDHRNFFSKVSLEMFLKDFFEEVKFYPLYDTETVDGSIYLICECRVKKYD